MEKMQDDCFEVEDLEAVLAAEKRGERPAHLDACPRCRALLESCRAFLDPPDLPAGSNLTEAAKRLSIARIAGFDDPRVTAAARRETPRKRFRLTHPWLRPVWVVGAMVLILVLVRGLREDGETPTPSGIVRGEETAPGASPIALRPPVPLAGGAVRLAWSTPAGAERLAIGFYRADLSVIDRKEIRPTGEYEIDPQDASRLRSEGLRYWQVIAYKDGGEIARSAPREIDISSFDRP